MVGLDKLNSEQYSVVTDTDGAILVVAGPGSGKTRALTHKIAYLISDKGVHPDEILAVTFTNKAAKEMKVRISGILSDNPDSDGFGEPAIVNTTNNLVPSWVGTFHSICARILRAESAHLDVTRNFVIYDTDDSLKILKEAFAELDISPKEFNPNAVAGTISRAKAEMLNPREFERQSQGNFYFQRVAKIYPIYQKKLAENNALDFDDLLFQIVLLFDRNPEIEKKYANQFRYVLIDEYQDTNKVQYEIAKRMASVHQNITVVGDVSQSIYSWRGADYRNMLQFQKDYETVKILNLAKNYRSTCKIVNAAKHLIENNSTHIKIDLYTENKQGDDIVLFEAEHERDEAKFITNTIELNLDPVENVEYMPNYRYKKFAVLYRTNAQSRTIEEAFISAGIPYRIFGGVKFYERKEIRDVIAYLRVFANPKDSVSWSRCINTPSRGIGKKTLEKITNSGYDLDVIKEITKMDWAKYIEKAQTTSPLDLLDVVLKDFGYLEYLNDGTEESLYRIENLKELRTVARQFPTIQDFLESVALVESSNKPDLENDDSVILMTIHSAKGLEFDNVFIIGMEEGIFPHSRSMADPNDIEEERRLCYVGITRAKKTLYLTYAKRRTYFGQTGSTVVSRFIAEIPEDIIQYRFG